MEEYRTVKSEACGFLEVKRSKFYGYACPVTTRQEAETAQQLYNFYHGISDQGDDRQRLESIMQGMTAAQLEQLTNIAAAMTQRG